MLRKLLIANRGEIACRVVRTARQLGMRTVAVYSDADHGALHTTMADEAVRLGPAPSTESYLAADKVLAAATQTGADAIHPGYGFLAENADFARRCAEAGIVFVGPPADAIDAMGNKSPPRAHAAKAGVPMCPATTGRTRTRRAAPGSRAHRRPAADQGGHGRRRQGHARGRVARRASTRPWPWPAARPAPPSATTRAARALPEPARATSRCRCSPTSTATPSTSATATAPSSAGTRRSSRRLPRPACRHGRVAGAMGEASVRGRAGHRLPGRRHHGVPARRRGRRSSTSWR